MQLFVYAFYIIPVSTIGVFGDGKTIQIINIIHAHTDSDIVDTCINLVYNRNFLLQTRQEISKI